MTDVVKATADMRERSNILKAAVYTGTSNLYPHMIPAVKSLLINSDVEKIYLLIEDDDFPFYLPDCVECINVSDQTYFEPESPNMKSQFTYMAMMRAALCHVLPHDLDRVLSLDVDTIVIEDISDLWNLPIDDCYFAAVKEPKRCIYNHYYTNIGVALYNLSRLRDGKADEAIALLNSERFEYLEQDVFNKVCRGNIYIMPPEYNVNRYTGNSMVRKIMHYANMKQWEDRLEYIKYAAIPWSEIRGGI